jgi:hypothetical protein
MYGYYRVTLVGLIGCIVTLATNSIVLISTISTIIFSFFCYDKSPWHDLFFHGFNKLVVV